MKKLILDISDYNYEQFRFEAMKEKKSILQIIRERILFKPFDDDVEKALNDLLNEKIKEI